MEGDWTCHRGSRMTELEVQVPFAGDVVRGRAWAFNLCVHGEGGHAMLVGEGWPCAGLVDFEQERVGREPCAGKKPAEWAAVGPIVCDDGLGLGPNRINKNRIKG